MNYLYMHEDGTDIHLSNFCYSFIFIKYCVYPVHPLGSVPCPRPNAFKTAADTASPAVSQKTQID